MHTRLVCSACEREHDVGVLQNLCRQCGQPLLARYEELLEGQRQLSAEQGMFACPEGGAAWAGARKLMDQGWIGRGEHVVVFNTGSGLKYTHLVGTQVAVIDPGDKEWYRAVERERGC